VIQSAPRNPAAAARISRETRYSHHQCELVLDALNGDEGAAREWLHICDQLTVFSVPAALPPETER
jgi:hypothetical protein